MLLGLFTRSGAHQMECEGVAAAAPRAATLLEQVGKTLVAENADTHQLDSLLDALLHPKDNRDDLTWDRATQMYLGLAAAVNARNDRNPMQLDSRFQQRVHNIANLLQFPSGPKKNDQFESPSNFDPMQVRQAFRNLDLGSPK